jgi:PKD repeat protein
MTVTGTLTDLNGALNGLQFTPTGGFTGSASLAVSFKDLGTNQTASANVAITVAAPPVTLIVKTFLPVVVVGEPVPFIIFALDTNLAAQFAPFKINMSFGDGNTATVTAFTPFLVNHIYRHTGVYTVTMTATDEFGRTSLPVTVTILVLPFRLGFNPFNPSQPALIAGGNPGDTFSFSAAPGGIAVTLDGVSQGVVNVNGPVILVGQPTKTSFGLNSNQTYNYHNLTVETPTTATLESDEDSEALQWAGLSAATQILNE